MTRAILILLLSTLCAFAGEDAWPAVEISEVRAYAWPDDVNTEAVILEGMTLKEGAINPKGALLTPGQTRTLIAAVTGKHTRHEVFQCYEPHNAFVLYDAAKKPVAVVEICFDCLRHRISPKGAAKNVDFVALAGIFDAHKLPLGKHNLADFKMLFDALKIKEKGDSK